MLVGDHVPNAIQAFKGWFFFAHQYAKMFASLALKSSIGPA